MATNNGSPPRAWGQSIVEAGEERNVRFTPTGVGTICCWRRWIGNRTVHPHGRGDNVGVLALAIGVTGSPPRAWGQFVVADKFLEHNRFTPTGVGTIRFKRWR